MASKFEVEYHAEYKKLNKAQKEAVDTIDGPVMVVAGPGTGKTQILALRIANILQKTDVKADGVLCLTFTNAAVEAMQERLKKYIGEASIKVGVFTFHSFGMKLIEEYYPLLKLKNSPKLMDEMDTVTLYDKLLFSKEWKYLRPRSNATRYFNDLKSLISLLKRKGINASELVKEIKKDIQNLQKDEASISTRGSSTGELKKEVLNKIEGLKRSAEFAEFFELYEKIKKELNIFDYDDVLENLVKIAEISEDFCADIRERFLYILIDEHQDSSGVQNLFIEKIWRKTEKPNIFVVGDDRQLIYGFGGASLSYFKNFTHAFGEAKLITLVENYRSTEHILKVADALLQSSLSKEKLVSHHKENYPLRLIEAESPKEEIIACGLDFKEKISKGLDPDSCAVLLPKNRQARNAANLLKNLGLPIAPGPYFNIFDSKDGEAFLRVLKIISDPEDKVSIALSLFDKVSGIDPISAHHFLVANNMRKFSLLNFKKNLSLFWDAGKVEKWLVRLMRWNKESKNLDLYSLTELLGKELLGSHEEITHTLSELITLQKEKNSDLTLKEFLTFLSRLEIYGESVPIKTLDDEHGIKILTLHGSKGLEFDSVWIAHMDEKSLVGERRRTFVLPEIIQKIIEEKDIEVVKRELYVAITRTKRFCTISYSLHGENGAKQELAQIITDLPKGLLLKVKAKKTEEKISQNESPLSSRDLKKIAREEYKNKYVSVSLLNNFFECPWKWYFRNLLDLPEPGTPSLEFGTVVHSIIDKLLKLPSPISNKELLKISDHNKEIYKVISRWANRRLSQIEKVRESEKSISLKDKKFPHLNIYGKIDLVETLKGGGFRVTDFKTGSVRRKLEIEKLDSESRMSPHLRQLAMYSYLLRKNSKLNTGVTEGRLEFLEARQGEKGIYDRLITEKEIGLLLRDISDYDKMVESGAWLERECHYNPYGKNTECQYCKMAEIYKNKND